VVTDNTRYSFISDMMVVRLNISQTALADNGWWTCNVTVVGESVSLPPNGGIAHSVVVGVEEIQLLVLVVGE